MLKKARTTFLMQSQIENAMKVTRSNRAAAEYLRVSFNLYKKFAKAYKNDQGISLYEAHTNQSGRGISKVHPSNKRFTLDDILLGKHPQYPSEKLFRRLIVSGYIEERCKHCGYCQKRPTDLKAPLLLNHIDGDDTNHKATNLEILCYNCYFVLVGNIRKNMSALMKDHYDRPEHESQIDSIADTEEKQRVLANIDILSEKEKLDIIRSLSNI